MGELPRGGYLALVMAWSACAPKAPSGPGETGGSETGASSEDAGTLAPTSDGATSGGEATTGSPTTGDASSSGGTLECAWDGAGSFCPLLTEPNIDLVADTPMGPVHFNYAYFGLMECSCPSPGVPAIGLFAQEQLPGLDPIVGDYLLFGVWIIDGVVWVDHSEGRIGDQPVDVTASFPQLMTATDEQTTPPLDPQAPPTMAGTIMVTADGLMLAGEFTASLCSGLNWTPACD